MFDPNKFTLQENGQMYGLHRFKDGDPMLCQRHSSGEWFTIKPATKHQIDFFAAHGEKAAVKPKTAKVESQEAEG